TDRDLFLREIEENSASIRQMTGITASHLCYPSGIYDSEFIPWLKDVGIVSATTCDSGLASDKSNRHLLPRIIDTSTLSLTEFEGWVSGVSGMLPRRPSYLSMVIPAHIIDII